MSLDRPFAIGEVVVPQHIDLSSESLVWSLRGARKRNPGGIVMLEQFLELWRSEPDAILHFAREWGVIGFCKHRLPASHRPEFGGAACGEPVRWNNSESSSHEDILWSDSLEAWRRWSKRFWTARLIGRKLAENKPVSKSAWDDLEQPPPPKCHPKTWLSQVVSDWTALGNIRPELEWMVREKQWRTQLVARGAGNLFGYLGYALMPVIAERTEYAKCSICHEDYTPDRRPSPNRPNYCKKQECKRAKWRAYKRNQSERDQTQ